MFQIRDTITRARGSSGNAVLGRFRYYCQRDSLLVRREETRYMHQFQNPKIVLYQDVTITFGGRCNDQWIYIFRCALKQVPLRLFSIQAVGTNICDANGC